VNDRINISVQRELPAHMLADVTFFTNLSRNLPNTQNLNLVDPRIGFQVGNAVNQSVPNPFYNLLPANLMPGQLRTQANVAVSQLLAPYPQYTTLNDSLIGSRNDHYKSLQIAVRRPFANGFNLTVGYNYNRESGQEYYNDVATYLRKFSWQPAQTAYHRLTGAAIYELPFGKGRKYMGNANRFVDYALGGWSTSALYTYNSGTPIRLGSAVVSGDPALSNPTSGQWFDTTKIKILPAFTERVNPVQYEDLLGPRFVNIDMTLSKRFSITERLKFELRVEGYNVVNSFTGATPSVDPTSPNFGRIISEAAGIYGRQIQYTGRFIF
jgi:hypothetical protein